MVVTEFHVLPGQSCDFCVPAIPARWDYPAKSFRYVPNDGYPSFTSNGGWLACEECSKLVEADDRAGLLLRGSSSPMPTIHRIAIIGIFFECRDGARRAFG